MDEPSSLSLSQDYSKVSCISHLLQLVFLPFLETVDLFFFSYRSLFKQSRFDMDSSEACLDRIESQRSTDVSHDQRNRRYFLMNLMNNGANRICSRGSPESQRECTQPPKGDKEFLTSLRLSDLYNLPGESVAMNSEILSAMRAGNIEFLEKMKRFETPMACFKNNKGDSILHLAASYGHLELAKGIVSACPSLLLEPNWEDRVPLHVAARGGHYAVVEALVASVTCFSAGLSEEERERLLNLYVLKDKDGDTPLHLALKDLNEKTERRTKNQSISHLVMHQRSIRCSSFQTRLMETAACLVNASQHVSFLANKDGISPLYLAVLAGNVSLVNAMLNVQGKTSDLASQLEGRKSLVHAALKAKTTDVLDIILNEDPCLLNERDEDGRTCLSAGASVGFYKGVCKLLDRSTSSVFECDDDGSFPIHIAVEKGHVDVVKEILKRCPDSIEQLNKEGQNVLHIAAKSGKAVSFLMGYIKRLGTKNHLIKEQDVNGNTPLHLATINWRPRTTFAMTNPKILNIQNKDGLRPLDIAEINLQSDYVLRERMTLMVLLCVYKPRGVTWRPTSGMTLRSRSETLSGYGEKYKDRVNVLLLVAALVATITFAAGFTMPGGFNNSGMAVLVDDKTFSNFLVCDTLAMQCSVIAIVALIWAQLGDQELAHRAFHLALPSLFFALFFMSSAFIYGVNAAVQQNIVLDDKIHIISAIFCNVMLILLGPYVIPQVSGIPLVQDLTSLYLYVLLWFVSEDDDEKHHISKCVKKESMGSSRVEQV
ncbi:protein ACCELERATED CELL DEATH 6-like [Brassica napus]|uniref:protein ACCELERATED CELL DEATH 6-like n=1 Tax=Brassica napus TaxID=3708 RepID=UPI002078E4F4|nr:protein ACCELERATED CELL DEATH 6-like [Brassica napus]